MARALGKSPKSSHAQIFCLRHELPERTPSQPPVPLESCYYEGRVDSKGFGYLEHLCLRDGRSDADGSREEP